MIAENSHEKTEVNYQVVQHSTHHSKRPHRSYHVSVPERPFLTVPGDTFSSHCIRKGKCWARQ